MGIKEEPVHPFFFPTLAAERVWCKSVPPFSLFPAIYRNTYARALQILQLLLLLSLCLTPHRHLPIPLLPGDNFLFLALAVCCQRLNCSNPRCRYLSWAVVCLRLYLAIS